MNNNSFWVMELEDICISFLVFPNFLQLICIACSIRIFLNKVFIK